MLTNVDDLESRQSLDYIFECSFNLDEKQHLQMYEDTLKVEKFLVNQISNNNFFEKNKKMFTQLSDHYGLSCEIGFNNAGKILFYLLNFRIEYR